MAAEVIEVRPAAGVHLAARSSVAGFRVTGSESEILFEALPVDDPQVRRPDITRARHVLGCEPEG
jgi:hypothetical protein